ncbi:MAG TPA: LPS export ABC transporter ATP-binding protein [Pseudolabrys sp.]|nr:LPS export ABC transporter ATP-binding protein [Pseudolabrys sp.]
MNILSLFRRRPAPAERQKPRWDQPLPGRPQPPRPVQAQQHSSQPHAGQPYPGQSQQGRAAPGQPYAQSHSGQPYPVQQAQPNGYAPAQHPPARTVAPAHGDGRPAPRQGMRQDGRQDARQDVRQDTRQDTRHAVRHGYLAAHGVEKSFGSRKVVKGATMYVRRGEAVGLLGPNGAGKTTIFYMITGLIRADKGRVELDGYDVTALPMYQRARLGVGYLPQEASIFRGLNVEDNIRAVLELVEPDLRRRDADLDALLEEFNITRLRKTPSIALSGGERRRVEIARALATRPSYMLLDEPFAGIDPIAVGDIQQLVRHLTNRGIGVLITDHNVRETLGLTDRAYIIYSGEVLMEGRAQDIVNNPDVRRLYLGEEFRL